MNKQVINANECKFLIKVLPNGQAHGLYLIRKGYPNHLLYTEWSAQGCRNWIFSHFIGEKDTKFNITTEEGKVIKDENGLHLE